MQVLGVVDVPLWIILSVATGGLLYIYGTWPFRQLQALGFKCPPHKFLLGHVVDMSLRHIHAFREWIRKYGRVFGVYIGRTPMIVIADLDILKEILIKDFNHFADRKNLGLIQRPWNQGVFFLGGEDWRRVRNIITPTFSSGKLKLMAAPINHCARTLADNFVQSVKEGRNVNVKELFGGFTLETIARTAFSLELDSQRDRDEPFFLHVRAMFEKFAQTRSLQRYLNMASMLCPWLGNFLHYVFNFGVFEWKSSAFFGSVIPQMMYERRQRREAGISKVTDFLQLLLNAEAEGEKTEKTEKKEKTEKTEKTEKADTEREEEGKEEGAQQEEKKDATSSASSKKRLTPEEVMAQAFLFFVAGYETTATTLQYAAFLLASRPEVQHRLRQEIQGVLGERDPSLEDLSQLTYLHQVLCETLRMYPPVTRVTRQASQDTEIQGVRIPRGMGILIPIYSIHHDPQYHPNPELFDPERFSPERLATAHPLAWMPFGQGPRICIGMRLALAEAKMALVHVLRKCELTTCPETQALEFRDIGVLTPTKPIILGAKLLEQE